MNIIYIRHIIISIPRVSTIVDLSGYHVNDASGTYLAIVCTYSCNIVALTKGGTIAVEPRYSSCTEQFYCYAYKRWQLTSMQHYIPL